MYWDLDPKRPKGISANGLECQRAFDMAVDFYAQAAVDLGINHKALGFGFSGNGSQVHLALRDLPVNEETSSLVKGLLAAASLLFSTADVVVDQTVSDPKRLCPAFGTVKRKGVNDPERPHRRSWFWCDDDVYRMTRTDLEELLQIWMGRLTEEQRADVDKARGKKPPSVAKISGTKSVPSSKQSTNTNGAPSSDPFTAANGIPVKDVAEWLDHYKDGYPICPGCGTTGNTSVAFVGNGLKCHHNRCAGKGKPGGFRTVVDLVVEAKNVSTVEAVQLLAAQFGTTSPRAAAHAQPQEETNAEWEEPIAIEMEPTLPPFPSSALPPVLRDMVVAQALATQTPPDLAGLLVLGVLSVSAARKFVLKVREGWLVALALYVIAVLRSGERKTPNYKAMVRPVEQYEFSLVEQAHDEIARAEATRARLEDELKKATKANDWAALAAVKAQISRHVVPQSPRLLLDDATPESIGVRLAEQQTCLGIFSSEGGFFDLLGGRYNEGASNLDLFLKAHDGEHARVDRIGRPSLVIPYATLAVALTAQPFVIETLPSKPGFQERGLVARLLYAIPKSIVGYRDSNPPPVPQDVTDAYALTVSTLLNIPARVAAGHIVPQELELDAEAVEYIRSLEAHFEPEFREGGSLYEISAWGGKLVGTIARIAALLHLAEHPADRVVGVEAVKRAHEIGEYLLVHAKHAFAMMSASTQGTRAARVLDWIKRKGVTHFSRREAFEAVKGSSITTVAALDEALVTLKQHNIVHPLKAGVRTGPGRPKGPSFEVNPLVHASAPRGGSGEGGEGAPAAPAEPAS